MISSARRVRSAIAAIGLLALSGSLLAGASSAIATTGDTTRPIPSVESPLAPADARPVDYEAVKAAFDLQRATERGVPVATVQADDKLGEEFGVVLAKLEGDFKDTYIQGEWRYDRYPNAQILMHEKIPAAAQSLIDSASFDIEVVTVDGPSRWEANDIVGEMETLLSAADPRSSSVGSYDFLNHIYAIEYSGARAPDETVNRIEALGGGGQVDLTYLGTGAKNETAYIGGNPLDRCTAGFTVHAGSNYGIATAQHCNPPTNFNYDGSPFWRAGNLDNSYGDITWAWSLSGTAHGIFRSTAIGLMSASTIAGPYGGMGHCTYGKVTFTSCATVLRTGQTVTYADFDYPGHSVVIKNLVVDGTEHVTHGDSGGPNFGTGGQMLGFTSGYNSDLHYSFWSAASALHNFAGVTAYGG